MKKTFKKQQFLAFLRIKNDLLYQMNDNYTLKRLSDQKEIGFSEDFL